MPPLSSRRNALAKSSTSNVAGLYEALDTVYGDFVTLFNQSMSMTPEVKKALDALLADFKRKFRA